MPPDQCAARNWRRVRPMRLILAFFTDDEREAGQMSGREEFATVGSMPRIQKTMKTLLLAAAGLALASQAMAQQEDKTVAIVNGYEIKTSEVQMAAEDVMGQLPNLPPKLRYPFIVDYLV